MFGYDEQDPQDPKPGDPGWVPSSLRKLMTQGTPGEFVPSSLRNKSAPVDATQVLYDPFKDYDTRTGAPVKTRMAIAGSTKPEDQLAVAKQMGLNGAHMTPKGMAYYKDDGKPAYVEPTLWGNPNPRDYLGAVATLPEKAGTFLGAAAGGIAGAPLAPESFGMSIPAGGATGAVAGHAAGSFLQRGLNAVAGVPHVDTRTGSEKLYGVLDDAVGGATQEVGGLAMGRLIGGTAKAAKSTVDRVEAMRAAGMKPTIGQAMGSRTLQGGETFLGNMPGGVGTMQRNAAGNVASAEAKHMRIAGDIAGEEPMSREGAGLHAQATATEAGKAFSNEEARLRGVAEAELPARFPVDGVRAFLKAKMKELALAPASGREALLPAIKRATAIVKDAQARGNAYDVPTLLKRRTEIGRKAFFSSPIVEGKTGQPGLRDLYDAVNEDIHAAAASRGPTAVEAQAAHDAHVQGFRDSDNPADAGFFGKVERQDQPEAATKLMTGGGKENTGRIVEIRRRVGEEAYRPIAARHYVDLGMDSGNDFNINTFVKNYGKLTDGEKRAIYGGALDPGIIERMDKFHAVMEAMEGTQSTAAAKPYLRGIGVGATIGGPAIAAASGHPTAALIGAAFTVAGAKTAATFATSQTLVSAMTQFAKVVSKTPAAFGSALGRLTALKFNDRDEAAARDQLVRALQDQYTGHE